MFKPRLAPVFLAVCLLGVSDVAAQRNLAPGVLNVIAPEIDPRDAHSLPMPLPGLEAPEYTPNFPPKTATLHGQTQHIVFFRDVWQYEFAFLGLRQLTIETQNTAGQTRDRNIWYMVYRIRNTGAAISHERVEDPKFGHVDYVQEQNPEQVDPVTLPNRFFGRFILEGWVQNTSTGLYTQVQYRDKVAPNIARLIQQVEDPDQELLNTVQMAAAELVKVPANTDQGGVWGVAVWYDVDPRIDYVSVKVTGLSNAYRISTTPAGEMEFKHKTLQLNFWRPGDALDESDDVVDYGIPLVDDPQEQIEIARRYELPGPVIRGERLIESTQRRKVLFEADADIQKTTFESAVADKLNAGELPQNVVDGLANAGVQLSPDAQLETRVEGSLWSITDTVDGQRNVYLIRLYPEFWEKDNVGGIRFIKRLDHLWIYR